MNDPIPPPAGPPSGHEPPSPFDPPDRSGWSDGEGQPPPTRPGGPGVRKPLLIGCGVILVLLVAALVVFYVNIESFIGWTLDAMHAELEPRLPEDLPDDLRARYDDAFERASASAREGSFSPEGLQRVQREYTSAVQGGGARLSVEEVERITEALEAFVPGSDSDPDAEPEAEPDVEAAPAPDAGG